MADIAGVDDLQSAIAAMNRELQAMLPQMVMAGALIVEKEILSRAPVLTGALAASLDAKADRRRQSASATVQIERSGPDGVEHYAIFNEYGTSHQPAKPFFRPGVEAAKPQVESLMTSQLTRVIHDR